MQPSELEAALDLGRKRPQRLAIPNLVRSRLHYFGPSGVDNIAAEVLESLHRNQDRCLLVDLASKTQWTGREIYVTCCKIATYLSQQLGLKPGNVIYMMCDHSDREMIFCLGAFLTGCAIYAGHPDDGIDEIATQCQLQEPDLIVTYSQHHELAAELLKKLPNGCQSRPILWADRIGVDTRRNLQVPSNVCLVDDLLSSPNQPVDEQLIETIAHERIQKHHPVFYLLTSGSTGRPKAVETSHHNLLHSIYCMISASLQSSQGVKVDVATKASLPLGCETVVSGDLPLDHGVTLNILLICLHLGAKIVIMQPYNAEIYWQAVNDYKIEFTIGSTTYNWHLLEKLRDELHKANFDKTKLPWDISSLRYLAGAGSKLNYLELIHDIEQHIDHLYLTQTYGCTEIGYVAGLPPAECRQHIDSIGYLMPGITAKVVDLCDPSKTLGPNEKGELLLWAESKFHLYKCYPGVDPKQAIESCHDSEGFYRTGDLVHYNESQRFYIHGRIKETLFLMQDWKILPQELEVLIDEHPLIDRAYVIGVPDPSCGGCECPKAFIKLKSKLELLNGNDETHKSDPENNNNNNNNNNINNNNIDETQELRYRLKVNDLDFIKKHIYKFVADRTAEPKHLRGGIEIVNSFPTNGLLKKVDRNALKRMATTNS